MFIKVWLQRQIEDIKKVSIENLRVFWKNNPINKGIKQSYMSEGNYGKQNFYSKRGSYIGS